MGRQRINLKYVVVGHISGESGSPSVGGHVTDRHIVEGQYRGGSTSV